MSNSATSAPSAHPTKLPHQVDVLVVGAGFAGLYLLHRMRGLGLSAIALEAASGVGGTWYWNRYPGARCDVESMQYSYSVFDDLQDEWCWSELYSGQPEILRYANHVADRYDLRRDIFLNTRVSAAHFAADTHRWQVTTESGAKVRAQFVVMATGCLSTARTPDFDGLETFAGDTYHTGNWPHTQVDFSGKRVGIIGTGSSAIQAIPVIAAEAAHVTVFQRTPNYSIPSRNGPMSDAYDKQWKDDYAALRTLARQSNNGIVMERNEHGAMDVSPEERARVYEARWAAGGTQFMGSFNDLAINADSNETASEFVRDQIREIVKDAATAELLAPKGYAIGTKRICVDTQYFETFNRDNVRLVDVRNAPIERFDETGLVTGGDHYAFDCIIFATGFDAMTGTLNAIDIRGRDAAELRERWEAGPRTYLGLSVAGFPNMFLITGPGSPSVLSNMMVSIEQHVDFITDLLVHMRDRDLAVVEAGTDAQENWVQHVNDVAQKTLYPRAASWYMGANIPGKPRVFLPYIGGVGKYRKICIDVATNGYKGFAFEEDRTLARAG